jgi:S1-C subfamily serine protease
VNKAKRALEELIATGQVAHIWLGLLGENMTPDQVPYFGLPRAGGMVVTDVFPNTPAEAAGIRPGDALLAIGGQKVQDKAQFLSLLLNYSKGDTLDVLLSRGREHFSMQLRPQVLDREAGLGLLTWRWGFAPGVEPKGQPAPNGITVAGVAVAGMPVASVREGGPAARLGLKPGDVILQIGSLRTRSEADLVSAFFRYQMHNVLLLSVQRGGQAYTVRMKI